MRFAIVGLGLLASLWAVPSRASETDIDEHNGSLMYVASVSTNENGTALPSLRPIPSSSVVDLATRYPWVVKAHGDLTAQECAAAARHDRNYWWSKGRCHMKYIRYGAGVVIRDTHALQHESSMRRKGELFSPTQYIPDEDAYCEHGEYCYPANDIKLLGSIIIEPEASYAGVTTSCELLEADRANIVAAGAQALLHDCR